jgi:hypothetical protein
MSQLVFTFCSFEKYPEDNAAALYGLPGPDTFGHEFPDFEYTSDLPPCSSTT